jgi:hypothetical protein
MDSLITAAARARVCEERVDRSTLSPKDALDDNVEHAVRGCLVGPRVEVCALSALCAVCVEVCALSALCAVCVELRLMWTQDAWDQGRTVFMRRSICFHDMIANKCRRY